MRTRFFGITLGLVLSSNLLAAQGAPDSSAEAGVRAALEHYLQGHATGDASHFRRAFHPEAKLFGVRDGQLVQRTSEEYIAGVSGRPAADEAQRKRRIVSLDISGNVAIATIELDYPAARTIDYMSLVEVGEEWKIINKTYYSEPKPRS